VVRRRRARSRRAGGRARRLRRRARPPAPPAEIDRLVASPGGTLVALDVRDGLQRLAPGKRAWKALPRLPGGLVAEALAASADETLWAAARERDDGRLFRLRAGAWEPVVLPDDLAHVRDLAVDAGDVLWTSGVDALWKRPASAPPGVSRPEAQTEARAALTALGERQRAAGLAVAPELLCWAPVVARVLVWPEADPP
jgi:hypothetical protein